MRKEVGVAGEGTVELEEAVPVDEPTEACGEEK